MAPKQNLDTGRSGKQSNALYRLVSYCGFVALQTWGTTDSTEFPDLSLNLVGQFVSLDRSTPLFSRLAHGVKPSNVIDGTLWWDS